jgi:hypothetical protein
MNGEIMQQQYIHGQNYITDFPNSFISLHLLSSYWEIYGIERAKSYLQSFSTPLQNHSLAKGLVAEWKNREETEKKTAIGMPSLGFLQKDTTDQDQLIGLSSFKGKYVLLDF